MSIKHLGRILRNAWLDGKSTEHQVRNVILFGIRYADELEGISPARLSRHSGPEVPEYSSEINVAKQLGKCVGLTGDAIRMLELADRQDPEH